MDKFTGKRLGRPRKVLGIFNVAAEGEDASNADAGNGQAGADRGRTQTESSAEAWQRLCSALDSNKSWNTSIAMAFHPAPEQDFVKTTCGWVRVMPGMLGYQLNSGDYVEL